MHKSSSSPNRLLPQSYFTSQGNNTDALQQCILDARRAAHSPDASPMERHLHRIVVSAGLESLHNIRSRRYGAAQRAERLVNDAIQQLQSLRLQATP